MIRINLMTTVVKKYLSNRRWKERNPDRVRKHNLEGGRKRRANDPQAVKAYHAKYSAEHADDIRNLGLSKLGWSLERFNEYLNTQNGLCAICHQPPSGKASWAHKEPVLNADHEHCDPPKPRALLCSRCNGAIGLLRENIEYLRSAIAYLEHWSPNGGETCSKSPSCLSQEVREASDSP